MQEIGINNTYIPSFSGSTLNPATPTVTVALARWNRISVNGIWLSVDVTVTGWSNTPSGTMIMSLPPQVTNGGLSLHDFSNGLNCILRAGTTIVATIVDLRTSNTVHFLDSSGNEILWSAFNSVTGFRVTFNMLWPLNVSI